MFFAHRQAVKRNLINFDNNSHTVLMNQYEKIKNIFKKLNKKK